MHTKHTMLVRIGHAVVLLACFFAVPASAFHVAVAPTKMTADASGAMCEIRPSRRVFGHLALGAAVALRAPRQASAEFPKISSIKQKDIDEWTELDDGSGLRLYDVYEGLGSNTKNGDRSRLLARVVTSVLSVTMFCDRMRLRYTVYLLDGTVVSRGQGVEQVPEGLRLLPSHVYLKASHVYLKETLELTMLLSNRSRKCSIKRHLLLRHASPMCGVVWHPHYDV